MTHLNDSPNLPHAATHPAGTASRSPVWPGIVGVFLIMVLLLSFQQVVQGAVKQGAEWHKTTALLASATRECRALPTVGASERCSRQLHTPSAGTGTGTSTVIQTAFFSGF